jgi:dipeptidase D
MRAKLKDFAHHHSLQFLTDEAGNVLLRKAASPGCEDSIPVVMQSHMDMVCSQTHDKVHDWHKDRITASLQGEYIKADRTTLGADNGVGVAASLAILQDASLKHGPLEALITADEETTMGGAEFIDPKLMQAKVLINLDSEEEHAVCVGCAGGYEMQLKLPVDRQPAPTGAYKLSVSIHGFLVSE